MDFGDTRCFVHKFANRVMRKKHSPNLLFYEFRGFRSKYASVAELMNFDFVEDILNFPTFVV